MNDNIQLSETASILLVDDREENLLALEGWLENPDLKIVKAASGNEALGLMLEEDFALVLLDVQMPGMDGFETAELMRLSEKTKNVPIIFVTAINKEQKHVFKGYSAGAVDYLFKPIDPDILKAKVNVFLQLYRQKRSLEEYSEERKQAEEALRESESKLRATLDATPFPMAVVDLQDDKIIYWSSSALALFGHTAPTASEWYQIAYPDPDYRREVIERWKPFLEIARESGQPINTGEYRVTCKDGSVCICELYATFLPDNLIVTFNDITERRQAEEEKRSLEERLNRAEKMESLGLLAGGVAHDLNNVLGIVVGYAELLLLKESKSNTNRPLLEEIMNGGQKAAAIVEDLLTLARRGVPSRNIINLNKIIADNQKSPGFKQLSSFHSSVQIKTELEPDLLNISGSSVHLGKTIFNLVSNASEAMPKGGVLTIKTTNQYLDKPIKGYDEIREGEYVVLSISDTGEGIPDADLKRVFEPFYTKKVMGRSGTGLGLSVVWGTIKDHNGYINVQSEEGKGSTFTLYFPVTREELSAEHIAVSISEYMGKGESILIVDDVKGQRALATLMLQELNYSVTSVESGEEALAYLKEHNADLMVLDMIMDPGMDGLDTYRSVIEIRPEQKAIIVSGFSESDRVKAAKALGAGAYVRKPYVIEKLGMAVKKELDR